MYIIIHIIESEYVSDYNTIHTDVIVVLCCM